MFKTLLVGLDGSPDSEAAIPVAADIARRYDALVVLCHVEERVGGEGGPQPVQDVETIQLGIQARTKELSDQGIDTKVEWGTSILGGRLGCWRRGPGPPSGGLAVRPEPAFQPLLELRLRGRARQPVQLLAVLE